MYDLETYERMAHRCRHRPYDTNCVELSDALVSLVREVQRLQRALDAVADADDAALDNGKPDMLTRLMTHNADLEAEIARLRAAERKRQQ